MFIAAWRTWKGRKLTEPLMLLMLFQLCGNAFAQPLSLFPSLSFPLPLILSGLGEKGFHE